MYLYDTYEDVIEWYEKRKSEFGASRWYNVIAHKVGDVLVWTYDGKRIAEHHPDNSTYLFIPREGLTAAIKTRWISLLGNPAISISHQKKRRATGVCEWAMCWMQRSDHSVRTDDGIPYVERKWRQVGEVNNVRRRIKIDVTRSNSGTIIQSLTEADPAELQVEKDKAKYADYNKGLKKLKTVITAQVKMGLYDEFAGERWRRSAKLDDYIKGLFPDSIRDWSARRPMLHKSIKEWIDTQKPEAVKAVVALCILLHDTTERDSRKRVLNQVKNGLTNAQQEYLRQHCVTITESNKTPSLTNENQECLVLPTDRLREVQVPCEAEVC